MADRPYGHPVEAALVRAAHAGGVRAPEVVGVLADGDRMGTGYVMRRITAAVSPSKLLAAPPSPLLADLGRARARIHALPRAPIPEALPVTATSPAPPTLNARLHSPARTQPRT